MSGFGAPKLVFAAWYAGGAGWGMAKIELSKS
jgi:hypothetical protein